MFRRDILWESSAVRHLLTKSCALLCQIRSEGVLMRHGVWKAPGRVRSFRYHHRVAVHQMLFGYFG